MKEKEEAGDRRLVGVRLEPLHWCQVVCLCSETRHTSTEQCFTVSSKGTDPFVCGQLFIPCPGPTVTVIGWQFFRRRTRIVGLVQMMPDPGESNDSTRSDGALTRQQ